MSEDADFTPDDVDTDNESEGVQQTEVASHTAVGETDGPGHIEETEIPNQDGQPARINQQEQELNQSGLATLAQQAAGGGSPTSKTDHLEQEDLSVLIGRHISTNLVQNELDGDVSDEIAEILTIAAGRGAVQALNFVQRQLYGNLDENAQNIVFENTITEPIKQGMIQELRSREQQ